LCSKQIFFRESMDSIASAMATPPSTPMRHDSRYSLESP
jgi:hypothetical protein